VGPVDEFGRCSSRYHDLECAHQASVDWLASGPPRATYEASLANVAAGIDLSNAVIPAWDDYDDPDQLPAAIPGRTLELAARLSEDWGLRAPVPVPAPGWDDLLGAEYAGDAYADAAAQAGLAGPAEPVRPSYPGISELRGRLGL
jgi:hypothetical protein